ncbi:MAG: xanthine dehydrogenase family protein subunit M [Acidobacteria bacterium]|nr:xanthine dehydrogenase family protein subunit M [Acidobacteriota bacterium]
MFPAPFTYVRPASLDEALQFLAHHPEDTKVLAGGQSLIPLLKLRLVFPRFVLDIGRLEELHGIHEHGAAIEIGSLLRHVEIERSELLRRAAPLLAETAAEIGDVQVRNRGTIGGSLVHADAAGDFPAAALALDAQMVIRGKAGERVVAAQDFFVDLMTSALQPDEILTAVRLSDMRARFGPRTGTAYVKLRQQASGFAIAGAAALISLDASKKITHARVAITGVNGVPYRAMTVEAKLLGEVAGDSLIASASQHAADGIDPLSDIHASADYRRDMACVITRRALLKSLARTRG